MTINSKSIRIPQQAIYDGELTPEELKTLLILIDKTSGDPFPIELLSLDTGISVEELVETLSHLCFLGYAKLENGIVKTSEWKNLFIPGKKPCFLYLGKTSSGWFKVGITSRPQVRYWQLQNRPNVTDTFEYLSVCEFKDGGAASYIEGQVKNLIRDEGSTERFSTEYFKGQEVLDKVFALVAKFREQHRNEDVTLDYKKETLCGLSC